jgi:hypothetical protein
MVLATGPSPSLITYDRGSQAFIVAAATSNVPQVGNAQPVGTIAYGIVASLSRAMQPPNLMLQIDTNGTGVLTSATVQLLGSLDGVKWGAVGSPVVLSGGGLSAGGTTLVPYVEDVVMRYVCASVTNFVVASGAPSLAVSFSM